MILFSLENKNCPLPRSYKLDLRLRYNDIFGTRGKGASTDWAVVCLRFYYDITSYPKGPKLNELALAYKLAWDNNPVLSVHLPHDNWSSSGMLGTMHPRSDNWQVTRILWPGER